MNKPLSFAWAVALVLILLVAGALIYGRLSTGHDWGDDFASYIDQARAIVSGNVSEYIQRNAFTIHSSSEQIGPVAYPWGYPLLLAAVYPTCELDVFCLKLLNIPIYLLFLLVLFLLLTRYLSRIEALLIVFLFAVNPHLLSFQDNILSDIPFMLFSTLALWLVDKYLCRKENEKYGFAHGLLLGFALYAAFYIRTTGILLTMTLFAGQSLEMIKNFWQTRKIKFSQIALLPYLVFAGLYLFSNVFLTEATGSYLSQLNISQEAIIHNLEYYQLRTFYFFGNLPEFKTLSWILLSLTITGMLLTFPQNPTFTIYTLATLAVYIVWPFTSPRFLYGIVPVIVYFCYYPIRWISLKLFKSRGMAGYAVPIIILLAIGVNFSISSVEAVRENLEQDRVLEDGPFTPLSTELFTFIRGSTPSESKIIFFKPRVLSLLANRPSLMINQCEALGFGDYVAIRKGFSYNQVEPDQIMTCNPGIKLEPVFENNAFIVYKIIQ